MGKTKTAIIDDSKVVEPEKKAPVTEAKIDQPAGKKGKTKASKQSLKKTGTKKIIRGKQYQQKVELIEKVKRYPLAEAVKLAQEISFTKFPGTVEIHINTNAKNIRGLAALPFATGKQLTILAFGTGAKDSGADLVGSEETIEEITKGKLNFDVIVTTPDWMPKLAKAARILGPRGLMPNPKNGTIGENLSKIVTDLKQGKIEYKTESNGQVIHLRIGKTNQAAEEICS
ncbi:MAG: 50S ribosomal protein L1 [Patescibacteria group bacterium]|nr:50S ribosomal protein L1 [Patescibacteria group bacterium]